MSVLKESRERFSRLYNLLVVLIGTGMCIGELSALQWRDVDFKNGLISVNKSLLETIKEEGQFHIVPPKTDAGVRKIPIIPEVMLALKREKTQSDGKVKTPVDGLKNFVFVFNGHPFSRHYIDRTLRAFTKEYNESARKNRTTPLPFVSCHTCRHTFATRLHEMGVNVKTAQTVLGHASAKITMDIYTGSDVKST